MLEMEVGTRSIEEMSAWRGKLGVQTRASASEVCVLSASGSKK